jgi:Glucosamine 6-phosphate synthetase, contains amidotransferase and phosphosugar isomerase domains
MCGIVGYVGSGSSLDVLLGGLKRLEYRGYDSAGISVIDAEVGLQTRKRAGKLSVLVADLKKARSGMLKLASDTLAGLLMELQPTAMLTRTLVVNT